MTYGIHIHLSNNLGPDVCLQKFEQAHRWTRPATDGAEQVGGMGMDAI
jgi:hypothetical protein